MKALAVAASRAPTLNAGTSLVSASTAQNVQTLPSCGSSPTRTLRSFLPTKPQISSISRRLQDRLRILAFINPMQPCPTFTPKRMIISRWTPVMRSIARILEPSVSAAMTAICLSMLRVFAMSINVIQNSLDVNDFCATIFVDMRYSMLTVLAVYCVIIPIYWQTASKNSATHQRQAKSAQTPQQPTPTPQTINVDTVNVNKFNVPQQTESAGKPDDNRKESPSYFYRLISPENLDRKSVV